MKRVAIDVAIFCATNNEASASRRMQKEPFGRVHCGPVKATVAHLGQRTCLTVASGMSAKRFRATFEAMMQTFEVKLLINFGAAGGVAPDLAIGTPTIPKEIIAYNYPELEQMGHTICCDTTGMSRIAERLTVTRAGSCPRDIRNAETREALFKKHRIHTTDWETWRLAALCEKHHLPFYALRCITDRADARAGIDYSRHAQTTLERSARLLEEMVEQACKNMQEKGTTDL